MKNGITKSDLIAVYGTLDRIGAIFAPVNNGKPLSRATISVWREELLPLRRYQLYELVPDIEKLVAAARRKARATA